MAVGKGAAETSRERCKASEHGVPVAGQRALYRTVLRPGTSGRRRLGGIIEEEFCWSSSFDADFIARLMAHGFLTMAQKVGKDGYALLPKMHRHRCALDFRDTHVARSTRRKAAKFELSVDRAFEDVIEGIQQQHGGECWFYPPLVEAFRMTLHGQGSSPCENANF